MGVEKWFVILTIFVCISLTTEFKITSGRQEKQPETKKHVSARKILFGNYTESSEDIHHEKTKRNLHLTQKPKKTEKEKTEESDEYEEDIILKHKARFKIDINEYDDQAKKKQDILSDELIKAQVKYSVLENNATEKNITKHGKTPFKFEAMFKEVPKLKDTDEKSAETKSKIEKEEIKKEISKPKKDILQTHVTKVKSNITKITADEKIAEKPKIKQKPKDSVESKQEKAETKKEKQLKSETSETNKQEKHVTIDKHEKESKPEEKHAKKDTTEDAKKGKDKKDVPAKITKTEIEQKPKTEKAPVKSSKTNESPSKEKTDSKSDKTKSDSGVKVKSKSDAKLKKGSSHKNETYLMLNRRRFDRLYYSFPSFAPNYSRIANEECRIQGQIFLRQLKGSKLWAFQMLDSTGKIPSGILRGNLNQLGDYDQCLSVNSRVKLPDSRDTTMRIKGKYCLAHIDLEATSDDMKLPINLIQARSFIKSKYHDPGHFIPRFTTLKWGLCLPDACNSEDAEQTFHDSLRPYNHSDVTGFTIHVNVDDEDCFVKKSPLKINDYSIETVITIGFYTMVVVVASVSTFRDIFGWSDSNETNNKGENLLMAFSLRRTTNALMKSETRTDDIHCIHGLRVICTFMLYIAHKLMPIGNIPMSNRASLTELANSGWTTIFRGSLIYTDTFLLISGVLTAYNMSREMDSKGHIQWLGRIISRFIRLTPALFATLLFYAYIFEYIGDGPLWNTVVTKNAELCKESWWNNIFYIQNYFPFEEMCATHTHQLALDMQLTLLAPILVWFLYEKPLTGLALATGLHATSVGLRYYTTFNNHLSLFIYHGMTISQLIRTANKSYAQSMHRATPYIAGVCLGVVLRQISKRDFTMPKIVIAGGWVLSMYFGGWTLYTPINLVRRDYVYDVEEAAQYAALCSVAWSLALSWIIFYCFIESKGLLNTMLGSYPMIVFSKISYSVYLTQFTVFFYNVGTTRTSSEFSVLRSIDIIEFSVILFASTALTLLLDIPMQDVKDIIMGKTHKEQNSEVEQTEEKSEALQTIQEDDEDLSISEKIT